MATENRSQVLPPMPLSRPEWDHLFSLLHRAKEEAREVFGTQSPTYRVLHLAHFEAYLRSSQFEHDLSLPMPGDETL